MLNWMNYMKIDNLEAMTSVVKLSAIQRENMPITAFFTLEKQKEISNGVIIIGASKYFNTSGMNLIDRILSVPPPKDPIAALKVANGYVELANWE